jgi:hypothetical protein
MAETETMDDSKRPPYIAYQSLKTLASNMKEQGVPGRVDKSVLGNFSGAVGGQIITALKFLDLVDDGNHPNQNLKNLVNAYGTDIWPDNVAVILRKAFGPIFELDLTTASPAQFNERFKITYGIEGDTLRKCITFFVNGVRDAQIPISSYIIKNKKPRSGPTKKRTPKPATNGKQDSPAGNKNVDPPPPNPQQQQKKLSEQLLEILDPNNMAPEETNAVWTLLMYLRKEGK